MKAIFSRPVLKKAVIATASLGLVIAAVLLFGQGSSSSAAPQPVVTAQRGDVEVLITASGTVEAAAYVEVGAQVSGQLKRLLKEEGDSVTKGEVVAEIDDVLLKAKYNEARATLDNLHAQEMAQSAEVKLAEQRAERYRSLIERDAVAHAEVEEAVSALDAARARLKALAAQVRQAEASVETAQANLGYTIIRAPISGIVVKVYAREGQTLNAFQTVPEVMRIEDVANMTVMAQVSEADVTRLRVGQPAYFTVLGAPDQKRYGKVRQIKPAPEVVNKVVFYNVLFDVPNDGALMSQMTAQVFFVLDRARDVVKVPVGVLQNRRAHEAQVNVLENGKQQTRAVKVGLVSDIDAAIESGLKAGETIVLAQAT